MKYRKLKGDKIFDGYELQDDKVLIVNDGGIVEDLVQISEAGEGVEYYKDILSPAFINCHCHLELSHMKDLIPEKTGLVDFVYQIINGRHHPKEEIEEAIKNAELEMYNNGIIAVGDICNDSATLAQKQNRKIKYYNFIEVLGWLPSVAQSRFDKAREMYDLFASQTSATRNHNSVVPHASYSVSGDLWHQIQPYFKNKVVSIHNQETIFEDDFFKVGKGDFVRMYELMKIDNTHHKPTNKSSLQSYFHYLTEAKNIILVHNTFITQNDLDYIRDAHHYNSFNTFFCLCINANQYIEDALPPVDLLINNNCDIVLGTDSLASNRSLSIADEIKTIHKFFPAVTINELLKWATINGARALNMHDQLGSFESGKKPGVIQFDANNFIAKRIV
ncbi:MAG: amidohydrolase family protein [Bacteroidota bacterium]|nr:amidohydrolase family protein [Bacteroidota bacterium]